MLVKVDVQVEQRNIDTWNNHINYSLYGELVCETLLPLVKFLEKAPANSNLNLYINSKGGIVPLTIGVVNFIKNIKHLNVITYNLGHCDSAAILLFMLGEKRFVSKNASFFMHSLQVNLQQPQTINSLKTELITLQEDTKNFIRILSENSNIPQNVWKNLMRDNGQLIKAKKAISLGIATDII